MAEDPIAQGEIAASTRHMEGMEERLTNLINSQGIALAMTWGRQLGEVEARLEAKIDALDAKIDAQTAAILKGFTEATGKQV